MKLALCVTAPPGAPRFCRSVADKKCTRRSETGARLISCTAVLVTLAGVVQGQQSPDSRGAPGMAAQTTAPEHRTVANGSKPTPPGPLAAAFAEGRSTGLEGTLQIEARIPPVTQRTTVTLDIHLRNVGTKEITAYSTSTRASYPDGTTSVTHCCGLDLLGVASAPAAVFGTFPPGYTLKPGEEISEPFTVPADTAGDPPVAVTVAATMLIFADRTARGDRRDLDPFLRDRAKLGTDLLDTVTEAQRLMTSEHPETAMEARASQLEAQARLDPKAYTRPHLEPGYLRFIAATLRQRNLAQVDKALQLWEERGKEELAGATLKAGGYRQ